MWDAKLIEFCAAVDALHRCVMDTVKHHEFFEQHPAALIAALGLEIERVIESCGDVGQELSDDAIKIHLEALRGLNAIARKREGKT